MQALRSDVLIPRFYNPKGKGERKLIEREKTNLTLDEIEREFGGYTLNDIPIVGSWINPETKESVKDTHKSVWIAARNTPETLKKLKSLKSKWEKRFEQDEITMYYIIIEKL